MSKGTMCHEQEVPVSADKVWDFCGGIKLVECLPKLVPDAIEKVETHGDGGVGSTVKVFHVPGMPGPRFTKEEIVMSDPQKRMKEAKHVEGGFLDMGFSSYSVIFEAVEKSADVTIMKTTVKYEIPEGSNADPSFIKTEIMAKVGEAIVKHLTGA